MRFTNFLFLSFLGSSLMLNQATKAEELYISPYLRESIKISTKISTEQASQVSVPVKKINNNYYYANNNTESLRVKSSFKKNNIYNNISTKELNTTQLKLRELFVVSNSKQAEKELFSEKQRINNAIQKASLETGLPVSLISAMIRQESNFNPNAISRTGAIGLTQLMPSTAKYICKLEKEELFNIEKNISCGAGYLKQQVNKFGRVDLALAAYNAGPGAVTRAIESTQSQDINTVTGVLKDETAPYVQKILSYYQDYES